MVNFRPKVVLCLTLACGRHIASTYTLVLQWFQHEGVCVRGRGETGRHARFRSWWRKPWGFKSLRPHHK